MHVASTCNEALALVLLSMESVVHETSRYLDTRHLHEMTRSRDPRDLCVWLCPTSDHLLWDFARVGLRMLGISWPRPLENPEVAGSNTPILGVPGPRSRGPKPQIIGYDAQMGSNGPKMGSFRGIPSGSLWSGVPKWTTFWPTFARTVSDPGSRIRPV